jgi:very-short-patch-repair endonuclease
MSIPSDLELRFLLLCRALELPEPVAEYRFCVHRRWRLDFAYPDLKVGIEIEGGIYSGGRHVRGNGFERDCEKHNWLAFDGWTVFRFTSGMLETGAALVMLQQTLLERSRT